MKAIRILLVVALTAWACARQEGNARGIEARVALDRSAALVGDLLGVTIEVETPPGYAVELPATPSEDGPFVSESIERREPIVLAERIRHHLLWTLRPRTVGQHALPLLEVPLVQPDGSVQVLPIGGMPFRVGSVREEVPEQEVFFDIRAAPAPTSRLPYVATGTLLLSALITAIWIQRTRKRRLMPTTPDPGELAQRTLLDLDAALEEPDVRRLADRLVEALWSFIALRWRIDTSASTSADLTKALGEPWPAILSALERARFERSPSREAVLEAGRTARALVSDVAR